MGAYGRAALREDIVGSVTRTALLESPVPLFLDH
jgi:nucleotide-binding universal stress UspA family protein